MLLGGGLLAVFGSEAIELGGAGPLAVVAAAFVSCYFWQKTGLGSRRREYTPAFATIGLIKPSNPRML